MTASNPLESAKAMTGLDRVIHEPARFQIMASLYVVESADFVFLLKQTGFTPGNLSAHLGKLESAGFLDIEKTYQGKRPQTIIHLNRKGGAAFETYLKTVRNVLAQFPATSGNNEPG